MSNSPRILFFDIETTPLLGWTWKKWETNIIAIKDQWHIISFSAKWSGEKHLTKGLIDYPSYKRNKTNDKALVKELWGLFDSADILVAHNGKSFDIKKVNARFSYHNLPPPSPYKIVDTKLAAKRYFAFTSNSLNDLGEYLGLGKKVDTGGFELWQGCLIGNKESWRKMKKYNRQDVVLLEKVYKRLLPYMASHPNYGSYLEKQVCSKCGSQNTHKKGTLRTLTSLLQRYYCRDCAGWSVGKPLKKFQILKSV